MASNAKIPQSEFTLRKLSTLKPNKAVTELFPVREEIVSALTDSVSERGILTPILIGKDGVIIDGHTRAHVAAILKMTEVPVNVMDIDGASDDGIDLAIETQMAKRNLTFEEKVVIARKTLQMHPEWSDRRIGRQVGMSHTSVVKLRKGEIDAGTIADTDTRKDAKGRTMKTGKIRSGTKKRKQAEKEAKLPGSVLAAPAKALTVSQVAKGRYTVEELNAMRLWIELLAAFLKTNPTPYSKEQAAAEKAAEKQKKQAEQAEKKLREKAEKLRKEAEAAEKAAQDAAKGKVPVANKAKGGARKGAAKKATKKRGK